LVLAKSLNGIGEKKLPIRFDNWEIDLTALPFFMATFLIPSISLESNSLASPSYFLSWLIEKILGWGTCFLIWWFSAYFVMRIGRRSISILWIFLIGFLGGFFGCLVGEISADWLGLSFRLGFFQRMMYTSASCICVVMLTSVLGKGRRSLIFFRNEIQRRLIRERKAQIRSQKIYSDHFNSLQNEISDKVNFLINHEVDQNNLSNLGIRLRSFSHDLFKDIDHHEYWHRKKNKKFHLDFSYNLFVLSLRGEPLNPNLFTLVFGIFLTLPLLRLENSIKSLMAGLLAILITFIIHNLQHHYWRLKASVQWRLLFVFDIFNIFILITLFLTLKSTFGIYKSVSNSNFLLIMFVIFYLFVYFLGNVSRSSDVAKMNEEMIRQDELHKCPSISELAEAEGFRIMLKWSKFIHGTLQAYLLINQLSRNPISLESQGSELKGKVREFKESLVFFGDREELTLDDCLKSLNRKWEGIISIISNIENISTKIVINSQSIHDLDDILGEVISNAVKHSHADTLKVDIRSNHSNSLVVRAESNGVLGRSVSPGLGSSLFDLVCGKSWSINNFGGKIVFSCLIFNH
jgi:hypothetical protein